MDLNERHKLIKVVMSYKVVEIQETDNFAICELYEKAFGKPMCEINSSEIFSWFYFNNMYKNNYCRALYNGSKLLAYWGFIPVDCKIQDKILKGSLSFQLASTQEVLGSTLLLWKKIKKELIKENVVISFTINHENSCLLLKKIGWEIEKTPILINIMHLFILINDMISKTINNRILKKIFSRIFLFLDYFATRLAVLFQSDYVNVFEVSCFDKKYNELWDTMSKSVNYGVNLDARYVNWRYIEKPNNTYRILSYVDGVRVMGYLVYGTKKDFGTHIGYIMDIIADPNNDNVINALIQCAKKKLSQEGITVLSALSFKGNIFNQNLKGCGFFYVPKKFLPHKSYFSINNLIESENDFEVHKWHISWGNHDNL